MPVGPPQIPTDEQLKELDALEDVVFVGYPNGIWDDKNYHPVIRKGITATPVSVNFRDKPQFLIDAAVYAGSSGSPVFLYNNGIYTSRDSGTVIGRRLALLGIVARAYFRRETNRVEVVEAPEVLPLASVPVVTSMDFLNLGIVFKTSTIYETIQVFMERMGVSKAATSPAAP